MQDKDSFRIRFILQFRIFSNICTVDLVQTLVSTLIFRKLYLVRFLFLTKYLLLLKDKRLCFINGIILGIQSRMRAPLLRVTFVVTNARDRDTIPTNVPCPKYKKNHRLVLLLEYRGRHSNLPRQPTKVPS